MVGAWHSWRDPARRGRRAVSAPDRDRPRGRHLHRAPSAPQLGRLAARSGGALRGSSTPRSRAARSSTRHGWRGSKPTMVPVRRVSSCAQRRRRRTVEGSSAGAISVRRAHRKFVRDAPDRPTSAMRPARADRPMTPLARDAPITRDGSVAPADEPSTVRVSRRSPSQHVDRRRRSRSDHPAATTPAPRRPAPRGMAGAESNGTLRRGRRRCILQPTSA